MFKWIGITIAVLVLAYVAAAYLYGRSLRFTGIVEGRYFLKIAAKDFAQYGYITNFSSTDWRAWLSTNSATVGGTQYQCYVEIVGGKYFGEGTLAMTTNQTFVWLDKKRPPKLIGPDYKPPVFPPRF